MKRFGTEYGMKAWALALVLVLTCPTLAAPSKSKIPKAPQTSSRPARFATSGTPSGGSNKGSGFPIGRMMSVAASQLSKAMDTAKGGPSAGITSPTTPVDDPPLQNGEKRVSNVAVDTDIRAFINDIGTQAGVTIIADETIKEQNVTMELKNETVEEALDKISLIAGAFWKKRGPGVYLVSKASPESSMFREFAVTEVYVPENQPATSIVAVLPKAYANYITHDPKTNMIGINAPEPIMHRILADIAKVDRQARQFVVEALVTEITTEDNNDFGFSWSWKNFALGGDLSLHYDKIGFDDVAKLKALLEKRQATLRANPRINAFEGRETMFNVGQDTYFSILSGNVNFPTAQIQLVKTGVTLKFTGYLGKDGTITLELEPEVSDAVTQVDGNPTVNVRRAVTNVRVKPGETIAIGGLIQESLEKKTVRVPILGSLPVIGNLFSQTTKRKKHTEVIIMITPYLTENGVTKSPVKTGG